MYNEKNDLISVIVPVYNTKPYLQECINSILSQTYKNIEIIIVDDGSDDGSSDICDKMQENNRSIQVYHRKNMGVSNARNFGISVAKGEYIGFIDSDDYIDSNFYEILHKNIVFYNADCSCVGHRKYIEKDDTYLAVTPDFETNVVSSLSALDSAANPSDLWVGYTWNKLYRRKLIIDNNLKFDEKLIFCEDSVFCYQYLEKCSRIVRSSVPAYIYRIRSTSITNSGFYNKEKLNKIPVVCDTLIDFVEKYKGRKIYYNTINFCVDLYITCLWNSCLNNNMDKTKREKYIGKVQKLFDQNKCISISKNKKCFFYILKYVPQIIPLVIKLRGEKKSEGINN